MRGAESTAHHGQYHAVELVPWGNQAAGADQDIGDAAAQVRTLVVTSREDLEIARQVRGLLTRSPRG